MSIRLMSEIKGHTVNKNQSQGLNLGHLAPHLLLYLTKPHCLVLETLETSVSKAPHKTLQHNQHVGHGDVLIPLKCRGQEGIEVLMFYLEVASSQW